MLGMIAWIVRLARQLRQTNQRYTTLTDGVDAAKLDDIWTQRSLQIAHHDDQLTNLERTVRSLQRASIQHVGFIRFNPFGDVGGDQSYALALLDGEKNGVVMSSIYSRAGVRTYAKQVQSGTPSHALSDEEEAAIAQAVGTPFEPISESIPAPTN